jgi:hypothetical protein
MDRARKWRLRAERYRDFAALAGDSASQKRRLYRSKHFDNLADEIEGGAAAPVTPSGRDVPLFTPLDALRRVLARMVAVAS